MWSLRKPSADSIRRFLTAQAKLEFTYPEVGASATQSPAGYVVSHTRINLGEGEAVFAKAKAALERWEEFRLCWVEACSPETPIQAGEVMVVLGRGMGLWWLNACRIVYVVDEYEPIFRFGFAYGTLPDHVGTGEERFLIEWDRSNNSVFYDILAFSRPHHWLTHMAYPLFRRFQKKFARDSAAAMLRAVGSSDVAC